MLRYVCLVLAAAACLPLAPLHAGECALESPLHRVPVLELYTSEGCNSCPPADRWFGGLRRTGIGPEAAVLLAFHVDYWNQLGWPDPFSQPAFSARQRAAAARDRSGIVYTPQVLLDGRDYRQRRDPGTLHERLAAINAQPALAHIRARLERSDAQIRVSGEVQVPEVRADARPQVWIATYENGLYTLVRAGENAGKRLTHDFVVRELVGPIVVDGHGRVHLDHRIALPVASAARRFGVAIFVQQDGSGRVLQAATRYPLC
jgi:hypothetical protein